MFSFRGTSINTKLATTIVVAVGAFAVPAVASADTAIPGLAAGDSQAYASLTSGGVPITAAMSRSFQGPVTLAPAGNPLRLTCTSTVVVNFLPNGTARVPTATSTNCTTNVAGCAVYATPAVGSLTPNGLGGRLVRDSAGVFRVRIGVALTTTLSGSPCPVQGSFAYTGVLSPQVTDGGPGVASLTFDGVAAGTVTSTLGSLTASGTLLLEAGQPAVFFRV